MEPDKSHQEVVFLELTNEQDFNFPNRLAQSGLDF